ncbi:MAG: F0F1 ATP synthase subunit A [Phycisphaerales bacterium JB039]
MISTTIISPDQIVYWRWGLVSLNATIVFTWGVMLLMAVGGWLATRRLATGPQIPRWQNLLEIIVDAMRSQMREIARSDPGRYLPFVGTIFLFIATCNLLMVIPGYQPPTGSLSTTAALAILVFIAVPLYGILERGPLRYIKRYIRPTPLMLPFNIIGELSRTLALAVRLFGNIMSGTKIVGILVAIAPLLFPVLMQLLGLLTGLVQAYIFAVLAMVYIASASRPRDEVAEQADAAHDSKEAEGGSHG